MSELKARHIVDVYDSYYAENPFGERYQVYLKSEADKVIAQLKADYKEACGRLQTANLIKDEQLAETRHQKWKRCLAMAKLCHWKMGVFIYKKEKSDFYYRWHKRWIKIAEQLKEGV